MPHKETKEVTLQRVKEDIANRYLFETWDEMCFMGIPNKYIINELCEAYRIERNKKEAPGESKINEHSNLFSEDYTDDPHAISGEAFYQGAKWAIKHFTNLNK